MADPKSELAAYVDHWYEVFPTGDAPALAALYTPDARLLLADLPRVVGHQAIGAFLASFTKYADLNCRHQVSHVDLLADDLAVVTGAAWVEAKPKTGAPSMKDASRFLMVMKREPDSGRWLCHYDMSNRTPDIKFAQ